MGWPFQILPAGDLMEPRQSLPTCETCRDRWAGRKQHNWNALVKGCIWLRNSAPGTSYVMSKFWTFIGTAGRKSWQV